MTSCRSCAVVPLALAVVFVGLPVAGVEAAEYSSDSGISLTYPDDWMLIAGDSMDEVIDAAREELSPAARRIFDRVDARQVTAMFVDLAGVDASSEFVTNVNIVVAPRMPSSGDPCSLFQRVLRQQLGPSAPQQIDCGRTKIAGHDVLALEFTCTYSGTYQRIRQRIVVFPGGDKSFVVTCSALASRYDEVAPIFDELLASVDTDTGGGLWSGRRFRFGAIAAAVALGCGLLRKLLGR